MHLFNWHPLCQSIKGGRGSGIGPLERLVARQGGRKRGGWGQFSCTAVTRAESGSWPATWQKAPKKKGGGWGTTGSSCHPSSYVHPIPSPVHRPDPHIASCAKPDARTQRWNLPWCGLSGWNSTLQGFLKWPTLKIYILMIKTWWVMISPPFPLDLYKRINWPQQGGLQRKTQNIPGSKPRIITSSHRIGKAGGSCTIAGSRHGQSVSEGMIS